MPIILQCHHAILIRFYKLENKKINLENIHNTPAANFVKYLSNFCLPSRCEFNRVHSPTTHSSGYYQQSKIADSIFRNLTKPIYFINSENIRGNGIKPIVRLASLCSYLNVSLLADNVSMQLHRYSSTRNTV